MTEQALDNYADSYEHARRQFVDQAQKSGARLSSYDHPQAMGRHGESLSTDVACFGPRQAKKILLMLAGTHGPEGFAGSAILLAFMKSGQLDQLPNDVGVVLVHAVNPYGFSHITRTNENNVDLNRNFLDFSQGPPPNPDYETLHPLVRWTPGADRAGLQRQVDQWIAEQGQGRYFDALFNGQYNHEEGLMFGGRERQWSNHMIESVVNDHLRQAEKVVFIDWHTGLGNYGNPFFLCFNEAHGPLWELCCQWWGRDRVDTSAGFNGASRPDYSGLVFQGAQGFTAPAHFAGAVIEFGTMPPEKTLYGLQLDNWLRFFGHTLPDAQYQALQAEMMEYFCPQDTAWRTGVLVSSMQITAQALDGLIHWSSTVQGNQGGQS